MAIKIKPMTNIVEKWSSRAQGAGQAYSDGIDNPRVPQAQAALAAEGAYEQGVQAAIGRKAFGKGVVKNAGKWAQNAKAKGAGRFGPGVSMAKPAFQAGLQPFLNTLSGLDLPPRGPKGDPSNVNRVVAVNTALRAQKMAGGA